LLVGVFVIPYLFPSASAMLSASSLAGFNNSLAYWWYVLALAVVACGVAARSEGPPSLPTLTTRPLFGAPPLAVVLIMTGHVALFAALYWAGRGFVFAEALYFQDVTYRVLAGAVPFVDFNFFYGPLLLYPSVLLSHYFGVSAGYAVAYVLTYLGGLYCVYLVLAALIQDRRAAVLWFGLFAIGFFNPILGLNYTFGRFLIPVVTIGAIWHCNRQVSVRRWFAAVGLLILAVLCSPEVAVVTTAAAAVLVSLIVVSHGADDRMQRLVALGTIILSGLPASAAALLLIDGSWRPAVAYFGPIVTFSAGAWSTPIDPSLPMLTLIGLTVLFVVQFSRSWWRHRSIGAQLSPLAAYLAIALLMQRASFGKADVLHIAYSGLPVYLAIAAWASWKPNGEGRAGWVAVVLMLGLVGPLQFFNAMLFLPSLAQRLGVSSAASSPVASERSSSTKETIQTSIARAVEQFGPDRLYYMHRLEYYRLPIYLRYRLEPFLYHPSLTSAFTADDIQGVIKALRDSRAIVLARPSDLAVGAAQRLDTHWWHFVTSSPLPGSNVYNLTLDFQTKLEAPLVQFLTSAYDQPFDDGEILGLELRGLPALADGALR